MKYSTPRRGAILSLVAAGLLGNLAALPAHALDAPTGKVVLTVGGSIANANDKGAASFDLTLLQQLPQTSFSTKTPWYAQPRKFSGVLLRDLLAGLGAAPGATIKAVALNDYRVDIPADDAARHGALLAYLLDDQPMSVREKGPLVIIYPFDDKPELRDAVHYSRAIWQLRSLEIK
ncbi:MAG TPA: molybdopterin-dependent oxidoreductase [Burkholderiaceae bacterium]|nr:molybdopterin-dependent oxidoreductase [Burkholderiaceae bacterium]